MRPIAIPLLCAGIATITWFSAYADDSSSSNAARPVRIAAKQSDRIAREKQSPDLLALADDDELADDDLLSSDVLRADDLLGSDDLHGSDDLLGGDDDLLGSDDLLGGGDDLLGSDDQLEADPLMGVGGTERDRLSDPLDYLGPSIAAPAAADDKPAAAVAKDPHEALWTENQYPSAESCRSCHPKHYDEWSVSSHAYAVVSPMFQRFEQAMQEYTRGTVGSFCVRCHSPVATQLELPRSSSVLDMPPVVREGITCIACHE
ncbi:cytochrome c family protein [Rhodopirellula maiorica SM1]|uniref:Cytochrome c family protein n=1 Tax=Rhodopirellula maiorica SM1 TaxID=1265738 RepID=M5RMI7_9BACT|nr:cytochrome c family protein [Rhodopirellula maiorica]EMI20538.1 cytochrome c family protein [Rhodopirellula maiorica SM1]